MTKKFTIGRDKNCDIPIADDSVSRLHAEITIVDGGFPNRPCACSGFSNSGYEDP
ncbi:MAG: FHA domain-containing protein [Deltaproteobacteria bacterium]|nr:FHA domain-containing protein [Deltaproteobacteria bacterium]